MFFLLYCCYTKSHNVCLFQKYGQKFLRKIVQQVGPHVKGQDQNNLLIIKKIKNLIKKRPKQTFRWTRFLNEACRECVVSILATQRLTTHPLIR